VVVCEAASEAETCALGEAVVVAPLPANVLAATVGSAAALDRAALATVSDDAPLPPTLARGVEPVGQPPSKLPIGLGWR
jgi:hypothetical protein